MMANKTKEFRDPVHNYVSVPAAWCGAFVDTAIFQRLRHIGQTSMRPLYPSAHHDRFTHSLGVFHLAKIAFHHLCENTSGEVLKGVDLAAYKPAFLIAALMHDCGHAPFSHTFEEYYNTDSRAQRFLFEFVGEEFKTDYQQLFGDGPPRPGHEIFSAAIFLRHFRDQFSELFPASDPQIVARMILGCTHVPSDSIAHQVEDCLIRLINGPAVDMDKLDYVMRDTWSSGVNNVSVDVRRLLGALEIVPGANKLEPAFRKSALSVVKSVIDGRNYLYRWVYAHHTVQYYDKLLYDALDRFGEMLSPQDQPRRFLDALFSRDVFEHAVQFGPLALYLPCDYDVWCWLKAHKDEIPQMNEFLCRQSSRVPLWKTQAEFEMIFAANKKARTFIQKEANVRGLLSDVLGDPWHEDILVIPVKPPVRRIEEQDLFIRIRDRTVCFTELARSWQELETEKTNVSFCYVYIPRQCQDKAEQCIEKLRAVPL